MNGRGTLALITARGGSKGLPGKNLRPLGGISLVGHAVRTAREFREAAALPDARIIVDTDAEEIAAEGRRWGADVPFLRPPELAQDHTSSVDTVLHVVERLRAAGDAVNEIVLLQPTAPLRNCEDVIVGWRRYLRGDVGLVVSLVREDHPPEYCVRLGDEGAMGWAFGPAAGHQRQNFPAAYRPNGAVYVVSVPFLQEQRSFFRPELGAGFAMPGERSVDIDSAADLLMAESLMQARGTARAFLPGVAGPVLLATRPALDLPLPALDRGALQWLAGLVIEGEGPPIARVPLGDVAPRADAQATIDPVLLIETGDQHPARL